LTIDNRLRFVLQLADVCYPFMQFST